MKPVLPILQIHDYIVTLSVYPRINYATCVIGMVSYLFICQSMHYFDLSACTLAEHLLYKDTFEYYVPFSGEWLQCKLRCRAVHCPLNWNCNICTSAYLGLAELKSITPSFHLFNILYRALGICTTLLRPRFLQVIMVRGYWYVYYCTGAQICENRIRADVNQFIMRARRWKLFFFSSRSNTGPLTVTDRLPCQHRAVHFLCTPPIRRTGSIPSCVCAFAGPPTGLDQSLGTSPDPQS